MILRSAIFKKLNEIGDNYDAETDKKKKDKLYKEYRKLEKVYHQVYDKDYIEKKNSGLYEEDDDNVETRKINPKKLISDEEYSKLMEEWSGIVGEKLLYPEEQRYLDAKKLTLKSIDFMSPEEQKAELDRFEYNWSHRKEAKQRKEDIKIALKEYGDIIRSMTPEEQEDFYNLRNQDESRKTLYKNTYTVKTNDDNERTMG